MRFQPYGREKPIPVFIANEERVEKIESKTIQEIKDKIIELAEAMPDKNSSLSLLEDLNRKKNLKKAEYIEMFKEAENSLNIQLSVPTPQELDNE